MKNWPIQRELNLRTTLEIEPVVGPLLDRAGRYVLIDGDVWRFDDDHRYVFLDWSSLPIGDGPLRRSIQHYVAHHARSDSPSNLANILIDFSYCIRKVPEQLWESAFGTSAAEFRTLVEKWLINTIDALRSEKRLWRFWRIRSWYSYCTDNWQDEGFSAEFCLTLYKVPIPQNPTGLNVHSLDPDVGPLSLQEIHALNVALEADTSQEHRSVQERAALRLCMAFGRNPRSYCLLLEGHFYNVLGNVSEGDEGWLVDMPRIKKTGTRHGRHKTAKLYCQREVMESVLALIRSNDELGLRKGVARPLFVNLKAIPHADMDFTLTELSMDSSEYGGLLHTFVSRLQVPSRVENKLLHLTPRRLRYTLGTSCARMGMSRSELAYMLDHSNTKTVEVYYSYSSDMLEAIDNALAGEGKELLGFFNRPVRKRKWEKEKNSSRVIVLPPGGDEMPGRNSGDDESGACNRKTASCELDIPLACYGCPKHEPFFEGPHHRALAEVDARIILVEGFKNAVENLMVLKRRILHVIEQCAHKDYKK
ncbi:hypothetical protein [Burkholderia sp. RS02]|uniref:hypothetical protein n=1 Tax=unclassified Burkholderia TaxID=2613784 RepID=UPI003218755E